jgi:hypothetical protein
MGSVSQNSALMNWITWSLQPSEAQITSETSGRSPHIKDVLEDHLYCMVCDGKIDLATAHRDISQNWIKPLPQRASFLKDQPWG